MRKYLLACFLCYCFFLFLSATCFAQKVSSVKINASNASVYRDSLTKLIFGPSGLPYDIFPDTIITNVNSVDHYNGYPYSSIMFRTGNLDSIDKMEIRLGNNPVDFPSKSKVYLFHPHNSNGKLFIYHSGHCAGVAIAEDILDINNGTEPGLVIPSLVAEGYTVLAVPMISYKATPVDGIACGYNNHDELFADGHYTNPLSFYFKPLIASLNYLGRSNYSDIYMCGLSGGGWATSVYPAIDSSVTCSFPIAGSWPMPVRQKFYPGGDLEQTLPTLYSDLMDYHEIYTLACLAPPRKMLQVNNRFDECCFAGASAHIYYVDSVVKALKGTHATFRFYLDETTTRHTISPRTLQVIKKFIANETASLAETAADSVICGSNYIYDIKNNFILNTAGDGTALKYSLLRAPAWLSIDSAHGTLNGIVSPGLIAVSPDTVSFKVEDSSGRFVVYNFNITKKRESAYFFTKFDYNRTIWFLPPYANSVHAVNSAAGNLFYFNNPLLKATGISIDNNSIVRIDLNQELIASDSIRYAGMFFPEGITYSNGQKLDDVELSKIHLNAVTKNPAVSGMIRFNSETKKFENFNGLVWVELN